MNWPASADEARLHAGRVQGVDRVHKNRLVEEITALPAPQRELAVRRIITTGGDDARVVQAVLQRNGPRPNTPTAHNTAVNVIPQTK